METDEVSEKERDRQIGRKRADMIATEVHM